MGERDFLPVSFVYVAIVLFSLSIRLASLAFVAVVWHLKDFI